MAREAARRIAAEALVATAASVLALAAAAQAESQGSLQPLNATSHWLNGEAVAQDREAGWRTTGVGLATHFAATVFWAAIFEAWVRRGRRAPRQVLGKALAMGGIAAAVDYSATPKRFTPGWEFVLTPASMALVYLALSGGLALAAAD